MPPHRANHPPANSAAIAAPQTSGPGPAAHLPPPYSERAAALARDIIASRTPLDGKKPRRDVTPRMFSLPFAAIATIVEWLVVEGRTYITASRAASAEFSEAITPSVLGDFWGNYISKALLREGIGSRQLPPSRVEVRLPFGNQPAVEVVIYKPADAPAPRVRVVEVPSPAPSTKRKSKPRA